MKRWGYLGIVAGMAATAALSSGGAGTAAGSKPNPGPLIHLTHPKPLYKTLPARTHGNAAPLPRPASLDVDTVANFSGLFKTPGFLPDGSKGGVWETNTLGHPPDAGGTTTID